MITIRAGNRAIYICLLLLLTGCSREQQDWRSAEAADTIDGYGQFIQRHPESELVTQARTRVTQLGEDRDWQHAGSADTVEAYREFLTQHPNGKWAQEARIRIENFSLGEQTGTDAASRAAAANRAGGGTGTRADAARSGNADPNPDAARSGNAGANPDPGGARGLASPLGGPTTKGSGVEHRTKAGILDPGEAAVPATRLASAAGGSMGGARGGNSGSGVQGAPGGGGPAGSGGAQGGRGSPAASGTPSSSPWVGGAGAGSAAAGAVGTGGTGTGGVAARPGGLAASARLNGFGIQLGAFSSEAAANNEWRLLTGRFGPELQGLQEHVVAADTPSGRVYRLQAMVGDEARARGICDSLRRRSQGCVAVLPH